MIDKEKIINLINMGIDVNKRAFSCFEDVNLSEYSFNTLCHIKNILENMCKTYTKELMEVILNEEQKQIPFKKLKDDEIKITKIEIDKTNKSNKEILKEIEYQLKKHLPKEVVKEILKSL